MLWQTRGHVLTCLLRKKAMFAMFWPSRVLGIWPCLDHVISKGPCFDQHKAMFSPTSVITWPFSNDVVKTWPKLNFFFWKCPLSKKQLLSFCCLYELHPKIDILYSHLSIQEKTIQDITIWEKTIQNITTMTIRLNCWNSFLNVLNRLCLKPTWSLRRQLLTSFGTTSVWAIGAVMIIATVTTHRSGEKVKDEARSFLFFSNSSMSLGGKSWTLRMTMRVPYFVRYILSPPPWHLMFWKRRVR